MASRNQIAEVVARRQVHRVRVRQVRPRRDLDLRSGGPERRSRSPTSTTRRARSPWTPDSKVAAVHRRRQEALQLQRRGRQDATVIATDDVARIGNFSVSPDSKWVAFSKQDRTLRTHVYIVADHRRRRAPHLRRPRPLFGNQRRSGRPTAAISSSRRRKAAATASRRRAASRRRLSCGRCRCAIRIAIR